MTKRLPILVTLGREGMKLLPDPIFIKLEADEIPVLTRSHGIRLMQCNAIVPRVFAQRAQVRESRELINVDDPRSVGFGALGTPLRCPMTTWSTGTSARADDSRCSEQLSH